VGAAADVRRAPLTAHAGAAAADACVAAAIIAPQVGGRSRACRASSNTATPRAFVLPVQRQRGRSSTPRRALAERDAGAPPLAGGALASAQQ
jgi:hypothetical protein